MTAEEIRTEIDAIADELDDGTEQWETTGNGPAWAHLEMLGQQLYALKRELANLTGQPA